VQAGVSVNGEDAPHTDHRVHLRPPGPLPALLRSGQRESE
jgi:hypothetical protein